MLYPYFYLKAYYEHSLTLWKLKKILNNYKIPSCYPHISKNLGNRCLFHMTFVLQVVKELGS